MGARPLLSLAQRRGGSSGAGGGWSPSEGGADSIGVSGVNNGAGGRGVAGFCNATSCIGLSGNAQSASGFGVHSIGAVGSRNYFQRSVGIGTNNPQSSLHVDGTTRFLGNVGLNGGPGGTHSLFIRTPPGEQDPLLVNGEGDANALRVMRDRNVLVGGAAGSQNNVAILGGRSLAVWGSISVQTGSFNSREEPPTHGPLFITDACWYDTGLTHRLARCGSSTATMKQDITDIDIGLDLIRRMRPVAFLWKENAAADIGLIAEEVAELEPRLTQYDRDGNPEGVDYRHLTAVLLRAIQELDESGIELAARLESEIADRDARITALEAQINDLQIEWSERLARLEAILPAEPHQTLAAVPAAHAEPR